MKYGMINRLARGSEHTTDALQNRVPRSIVRMLLRRNLQHGGYGTIKLGDGRADLVSNLYMISKKERRRNFNLVSMTIGQGVIHLLMRCWILLKDDEYIRELTY